LIASLVVHGGVAGAIVEVSVAVLILAIGLAASTLEHGPDSK